MRTEEEWCDTAVKTQQTLSYSHADRDKFYSQPLMEYNREGTNHIPYHVDAPGKGQNRTRDAHVQPVVRTHSSSNQQDNFFEYQNGKMFLDKAALIKFNGNNMPFIFFKNRITALMRSCPFTNVHLTLLQAACDGAAAQTIANLMSDTPGLSETQRINMRME